MEAIAEWCVHSWRRTRFWFKDDVFRRLAINAGKLLTANGIAAALGLVTAVLTARWLGPEKYGVLALVLAYEATIGKLVAFNAWQAIIKFGSEALQANDRVGLRQVIKFGFILDVSSAIIGVVVAMVLSRPVISLLRWDPSTYRLLMLYSVLILFSLNGTPIGILRMFDRFDLLSYAVVLGALLKLGGVVWCLFTAQSVQGFVLVYLITGIIGQSYQVTASLWVLRQKKVDTFVFEPLHGLRRRFHGIWDYVWTTNVNSTVRMLSREADILIIGGLATPGDLGFFKIAKQFSQVLSILSDPFYQSVYPELARLWAASKRRDFLSLIKRTALLMSGIALSVWVGFMLFGHWLISLTVGSAYSKAYVVTVVYMLALVIALCTLSFTPAMLAIGLPKRSFVALTLATIAYFFLLLVSVNTVGIIAASLSYVGFYIVWSGIMICFLKPYLTGSGSSSENWAQETKCTTKENMPSMM